MEVWSETASIWVPSTVPALILPGLTTGEDLLQEHRSEITGATLGSKIVRPAGEKGMSEGAYHRVKLEKPIKAAHFRIFGEISNL